MYIHIVYIKYPLGWVRFLFHSFSEIDAEFSNLYLNISSNHVAKTPFSFCKIQIKYNLVAYDITFWNTGIISITSIGTTTSNFPSVGNKLMMKLVATDNWNVLLAVQIMNSAKHLLHLYTNDCTDVEHILNDSRNLQLFDFICTIDEGSVLFILPKIVFNYFMTLVIIIILKICVYCNVVVTVSLIVKINLVLLFGIRTIAYYYLHV